jgi:hypothetical protein
LDATVGVTADEADRGAEQVGAVGPEAVEGDAPEQ